MKKLLLIVASMLLTASMSYAGMNEKAMEKGSETGMMKKSEKMMKKDGSCGAGKCGSDMKKGEMKSGSCGAGKCGGDMKKKAMDKMGDKSSKKPSGSCGAGKCGW